MTMRPTIAVAWPKDDYLAALERAGATPRVIDAAQDDVQSVLDGCDGVLLTGGADVDPVHYGDAERHPTLSLEQGRDEYELALARGAMAQDVPLLAICRGVQLLNVAAGGTLIQDLPSQNPSPVNHRVVEPAGPADQMVHTVSVEPGSRLSALLGASAQGEMAVNSRHHQAVKDVAPGFVTAARAADGVVEGIERRDRTFCLGVQWHPENFWKSGEFTSLFAGFVEAARALAASRTKSAS